MHTCHLGLYQVAIAEGLILLQEYSLLAGIAGSRTEAFRLSFTSFRSWCRANKIGCSMRAWTAKSFHVDLDNPQDFPWINGKAFNSRCVLGFCAHALAAPAVKDFLLGDPPSVPAGFANWSQFARFTTAAVLALSAFQDRLEGTTRYLTQTEAADLHQRGLQFLELSKGAHNLASASNKMRWLILPKNHVFEELLVGMSQNLYSCRYFHNFSEEDLMGSLKTSCRRYPLNSLEQNVLRNSLINLVAASKAR